MPKFSKYFGSQYLNASDLLPLNKHWAAIVDRIVEERVGPEREEKPVLYMSGPGPCDGVWKPYVVNKLNGTKLMEDFGDDFAACKGKAIELWAYPNAYQDKPGIALAAAPGAALDDEIPGFDTP
jgi:hypothetical protein